MDYDGRVVFKIDGDDSGLRRAVSGAESSLSSLKSTIVKLGLGALLTKGMKDAVQATNKFETSLAKASTLFGNVAVDTDNLSKKILELSSATGQASDAIGNSLYNALSAGVAVTEDMGDAMSFLESATKLSVAGFTDVDTAVTATAKVMNAYGMSMEEAGRIGEVLMETQNLGITTVNELGSSLATVTPLASSFGVQFEQVGASLALMTKKGTDTATATTQLRGLIQELGQDGTTASKNLQKAFERAGLEYRNFAEYMKDPSNNLQTAVQLLADEAEATGVSLSDMFSNVRAGVGALQLASDEMGVFNTFMEDMAGDTNLVEQAYNKMMDTRANKWKRMREQLKNITIGITDSDAVQGIMDTIIGKAQGLLDKIEEWLPSITQALDLFSFDAQVIFASLKRTYDESFLKKGVDFVIKLGKNELQDIIDKFTSGDIFGSIAQIVGDVLIITTGFDIVKTGIGSLATLTGAFTDAFTGLEWASIAGAMLTIYTGVKWAMSEDKWGEFTTALLMALIPATIAGAFLGVQGGALVFAVSFKIFRQFMDGDNANTVAGMTKSAVEADPTQSADAFIDMVKASDEAKEAIKGQVKDVQELDEQLTRLTAILNETDKKYTSFEEKMRDALDVEVGRNVVLGLIEGMEDIPPENMEKFSAHVIQMIRNAFNIQSPSKDARDEVGYWIGLGIAEGIWSEDTAKEIDESIRKIRQRIIEDAGKSGGIGLQDALTVYPKILAYGNEKKKSLSTSSGASAGDAGATPTPSGGGNMNLEPPKPTAWQNFWKTIAIGADTGIKGLFDFSEGMTVIEDGVEVLTEKGQFWADVMNDAIGLMLSSFEQLGEDLVEGKASWKSFAKAGLEALASILEALGYQLASMAISTYPNFAQMALSAAGSALAFTGAGLVRGFAGKFEYGGIVGGHGITGDKHMIYANAGELILSRAQQGVIASQLGNQASPNINISFNGNVFGDEQTISEFVYNGIKTAQAEGIIQAW